MSTALVSEHDEAPPPWRASLPFALALSVPAVGVAVAAAPTSRWTLVLPLLIFVALPLIDLVAGRNRAAITPASAARLGRDWRFDLWLWLWVSLQLVALFGTLAQLRDLVLSTSQLALVTLSMGIVTGVGINVAHELMHRRGRAERALAELLMTTTLYTHFCVEHVLGHHKHVSTPQDPASSRLDESVFAYLPRTVLGGLRSAWRIETARVQRAQVAFTLRDRRLRYALEQVAVVVVAGLLGGVVGIGVFVGQAIVAVVLLEVINYIEHYGLKRRELRSGVYERCLPVHSWNASERVTNWFLFHLQRHADHHHIASRPYFALRHIDDSPQMPTGYAGMILLALVPPLWRSVMNPRVQAWRDREAHRLDDDVAGAACVVSRGGTDDDDAAQGQRDIAPR